MLTIKTIKSGIREKEEYYTEDESLASELEQTDSTELTEFQKLTTAVWHEIGTKALGPEGIITKEDFKSLLYGHQLGTTDRIRGTKTHSKSQERLAEDLTFSAPKSVSIALHIGQDWRLFEAHTQSVKEVLDEVGQRYLTTRIQKNGERQVVKADNAIVALIPHHTSRDGDLQLHTHAVIMNGTKGDDGVWRSLHNDALSRQRWLGNLYRQKLAQKVQELGYSIYETKDGFEIEGIKRGDIEAFSKRSRSIIQQIEKQGLEVTPENRDRATLTTRKAKHITQSLEEFQQQWKDQADLIGVQIPSPSDNQVQLLGCQTASEALNSAIAHFEERSVAIAREEIYHYVFNHIQSFHLSELDQAINSHPELISVEGGRFTTVGAIEREIETVGQWMKGQGQATPLLPAPNLEGTKLNSGQAEAIALTLTSSDTHQIIHGLSGVGKTTALGELKRQLDGTGIEIRGFSPTIEAASQLQKELGITTNTNSLNV
ncbi:MobF family relaxase, partial [Chroococcus sp. FPU101]|uniref:MobF family relaxase n=1 Tax=Chroococcus sp. FPU101 TaxID=1974212 RepID=UPI001A8CB6FD